jgi:hypothetical protein
MKYVLVLLFFTTPPAQHVESSVRKAKSPWSFQSSTSAEFDSEDACEQNGKAVLDSLDMVDTMTGVGWCFCKSEPGSICEEDKKKHKDSQNEGYTSKMFTPRGAAGQTNFVVKQLIPGSLQKAIQNHKK